MNQSAEVQIIRDVQYGEADGVPLFLDVVQPLVRDAYSRPAILEIHGGGWSAGEKEIQRVLRLARAGFFCVSINYRLSPQHLFPAHIHDCKAAVRWLRVHASDLGVDTDHIGVWGGSAGGHLAALLGTSYDVPELEGDSGWPDVSARVQAVVSVCGASDFSQISREHLEANPVELFGGSVYEHPELVQLANPIAHLRPDAPPFLLFHGDADELSPYEQSLLLRDALERVGVPVALHTAYGGKHGFTHEWDERIDELRTAFFKEHLGDPKQEPSR